MSYYFDTKKLVITWIQSNELLFLYYPQFCFTDFIYIYINKIILLLNDSKINDP